jgi:hypothetical protein
VTPPAQGPNWRSRSRSLNAHIGQATRERARSAALRRLRLLRAARAALGQHRTGSCGGACPGAQQRARAEAEELQRRAAQLQQLSEAEANLAHSRQEQSEMERELAASQRSVAALLTEMRERYDQMAAIITAELN